LTEKLLNEFCDEQLAGANGSADEALLTVADLMILLSEVDYEPVDGAVTRDDFTETYAFFLDGLVEEVDATVQLRRGQVSNDVFEFWNRVAQRCRKRGASSSPPS
jgi:hypothetical protein